MAHISIVKSIIFMMCFTSLSLLAEHQFISELDHDASLTRRPLPLSVLQTILAQRDPSRFPPNACTKSFTHVLLGGSTFVAVTVWAAMDPYGSLLAVLLFALLLVVLAVPRCSLLAVLCSTRGSACFCVDGFCNYGICTVSVLTYREMESCIRHIVIEMRILESYIAIIQYVFFSSSSET